MPAATDLGAILTAMVTPFDSSGALREDAIRRLARHLVEHGSDGLVVAGTTGEAPTLDDAEKLRLMEIVVDEVGDQATVVAGTGSNDTAHSVHLTAQAAARGVDAVLVVTPYYNKPNRRGLVEHFKAVAAATDLPVLLYNIPGRTGVEMAPATTLRLAEDVANIAGVKDAVDNVVKAAWLAARAPQDFGIWSGSDALNLPLLAVGAVGVVSVAGHLVGDDLAAMVETFPTDPAKAREIAMRIEPLCSALFVEPSPGPLKAALGLVGLPGGPVRPPLVDAGEETLVLLREALTEAGVAISAGARGGA
jgi:4-hydroxy-tetrahydrodipicolinate synthase